jgi:hypothetical protein
VSPARFARLAAPACFAALLSVVPLVARAAQYPPGPGGCCPETLTIINIKNPLASPHPLPGDIVNGVGGIITAFHVKPGTMGFYMQMANGLPFSGIHVITGRVDHGPGTASNLHVGDSVVVYGKVQRDHGSIVIGSASGDDDVAVPLEHGGDDYDVLVRLVSSGHPVPPIHAGTLAELARPETNPNAWPWTGMLVSLDRALGTAPANADGDLDDAYTFLVSDPACPSAACDSVLADVGTLTHLPLPAPGTRLRFLRGCFDLGEEGYLVRLRGADDMAEGTPPVATDAFPIFDNDQPGSQRIDSVMVVFDRPVRKSSAESLAHYSLGPSGTLTGALRLDAPDDNRVVLAVQGAPADGTPMTLVVSGVESLVDLTPMIAPQSFDFLNGVLELESIAAPSAAALLGSPCDDRSNFSGPGSAPGPRVSFSGVVTGAFAGTYSMQGIGATRAGLWVDSPSMPLEPGHTFLVAGALAQVDGETRATGIRYVHDLGPASLALPAVQSTHVLSDVSCDPNQLILNAQDYDGMLATLVRVRILTSAAPGAPFLVGAAASTAPASLRGPAPMAALATDELLVVPVSGGLFTPVAGEIVTVTGVVGRSGGGPAVYARGDADLYGFGPAPTFTLPLDISKAATDSRDPDLVLTHDNYLFMAWGRNFHETAHSLSQDAGRNWSQGRPVSHQGVQPSVAVTPANTIFVLQSGLESLHLKRAIDGGFRMDALRTEVDPHATAYSSLAVGAGENLHAAWERPDDGLYYARSLTAGDTFSNPVPVALDTLPTTNTMVRACATTGDHVFLFWQYHSPGEPAVDKVLYRRSTDGGQTFSNARQVRDEANPLTSVSRLAFLGDAHVGPQGQVDVLGVDDGSIVGGAGGQVVFLRSTNDGLTFGLTGVVPSPSRDAIALCPKSFIVGPDGTIHVLSAICGESLWYTRSTDGGHTWTDPVNVSAGLSATIGEPRGAKIVLDGDGNPVISWFAPVGSSTEIFTVRGLH